MVADLGGGRLAQAYDTVDVSPRERFGYWHDVVCGQFVPATSLDKSTQNFHARLTTQSLGFIELSRMRASPHFWSREDKHIRADDHDEFLLSVMLGGTGCLEQSGRTTSQNPGEIVLYDTSRRFKYDLASDILLVKIPHKVLASRLLDTGSVTAVAFRRDLSINGLLSNLIEKSMTIAVPEKAADTVGVHMASSIVDLICALIDLESESETSLTQAQMNQLERVQRYAAANLGDERLSIEKMAEFGAVSTRTLNRLFAKAGTTPMRWVWQQRLEASHAALADGRAKSVTEAAFQFGFSELSHYSRSFKSAFGTTPESLLRKSRHG